MEVVVIGGGGHSKVVMKKIKLDVWYEEHWSFWLDIKILFKTVWVVAKGEGLYSEVTTDEIVKTEDENG